MKNLNYFIIIIFVIFIGLFWSYYNDTVTDLEFEINQLTIERDELKNKIIIIEEGFIKLSKGNPERQEKNTKTIKTKPTNKPKLKSSKSDNDIVNVVEENIYIKDVSLGFPNRTGQDLVNSLKLKTEL